MLPFDPADVFGKTRAPVKVTLNGHTYRSTVSKMSGECWIPVRKSNQQAAGVVAGQTVQVHLELDTAKRTVKLPPPLKTALVDAGMLTAFKAMSFTHQREWAEAVSEAKKAETRGRRVAACVEAMHKRVVASKPRARTKSSAARASRRTTNDASRKKSRSSTLPQSLIDADEPSPSRRRPAG